MTDVLIGAPNPEWAPLYYTKRKSESTQGTKVWEWLEELMLPERGMRQECMKFTDWQKWFMENIFELDAFGRFRYRKYVIGLPRKNGKSFLCSGIALYFLLFGGSGAQIYSAAKNSKQARIVFDFTKKQVLRSKFLMKHIIVRRDELVNRTTGAVYKPLTADGNAAQGLAPYIVIADELHTWGTESGNGAADEMWPALVNGSSDRPESMVIGITTAGANVNTLAGELYEYGKKVSSGEVEDDSFGFMWWEAPDGADITDPKTWEGANPNLKEGLISYDDFTSLLASASGATGFNDFLRYKLNKWVTLAGEAFVSDWEWQQIYNAQGDIELGASVVLGFDGSRTGDSTVIVLMDVLTGVFMIHRIWEIGVDGLQYIDNAEVMDEFRNVFELYDVVGVAADESYYQNDLRKLGIAEYPDAWIELVPQSSQRMAGHCQDFTKDVSDRNISHIGQEPMTRHARNGILREDGSVQKNKKKSKHKIDALVAAILANYARREYLSRVAGKLADADYFGGGTAW